ncbi:hypothetical protein BGZ54_002414, partial [Gamsiella multidivaricata]
MEPTSGTGGSASGTTPSGVSSHSTTASSSQSATGSHSTGATQSPSAPAAISRSEQKKAKAVNDAIDKSLRADKERLQKERGAKLLIL